MRNLTVEKILSLHLKLSSVNISGPRQGLDNQLSVLLDKILLLVATLGMGSVPDNS